MTTPDFMWRCMADDCDTPARWWVTYHCPAGHRGTEPYCDTHRDDPAAATDPCSPCYDTGTTTRDMTRDGDPAPLTQPGPDTPMGCYVQYHTDADPHTWSGATFIRDPDPDRAVRRADQLGIAPAGCHPCLTVTCPLPADPWLERLLDAEETMAVPPPGTWS